ncbi:Nmad2 family putative nucleotide modification protein [Rhodoferax antarcticus]|uniref:Nmad2 family putative nucleotide modification protein n=1 Tax=Rhodoferax antarcticus TaxID=81479 RepID=UPI0022244148|nr:hypothetical protein [Rhodoferax antarcticus]MCW2311329.1 hypothetical protein [Rhodoferax antarcticus]
MEEVRLFTYRLTHDSGFAPNPFHGYLTLATCKPGIRRTKMVGDWVAGFASKALVIKTMRDTGREIQADSLIYLMKVTDVVPLEKYFDDPRFQVKQPRSITYRRGRGDNIYRRNSLNIFEGVGISDHSDPQGNYDDWDVKHDTDGKNALVSTEFYYLGADCTMPSNGWLSNVKLPTGPTCYGIRNEEKSLDFLRKHVADKGFKLNHVGTPCLEKTVDSVSTSSCGGCSS